MSSKNIIVLKFGGSVLHSQADFDQVQFEIERHLDLGRKVIAVVSAFYGVTEQLIHQANTQNLNADSVEFAALIASGEFRSATELVAHLNQASRQASCQTPKDLEFLAQGNRSKASPVSLNPNKVVAALTQTPVIVVPGFSAINEFGECVLLGRGGSDISAVCIAHALGLDSVRLLKDVDGLYDQDPNKYPTATRLEQVDYTTACEIGGELIQTEAIDFAQSKAMAIDVARIGSSNRSRIGAREISNMQKTA